MRTVKEAFTERFGLVLIRNKAILVRKSHILEKPRIFKIRLKQHYDS